MEILTKIYIGILEIIFGIGIIFFAAKRPNSYPLTSAKFQLYVGGFGFILIGIIYIFNELNLWE